MDNSNDFEYGQPPSVTPSSRRRKFDNRPHKSRGWIPITILLSIIAICFIGVFVMVGSFVSMVGSMVGDGFKFSTSSAPVEIKDKTILKLDFGSVSEISQNDNPFSFFNTDAPSPTFNELIKGIKAATDDDRIIGIYYDGSAVISGAMAAELKSALLDFKRAGKFMYSYLETGTMSQYSIALLSDSIFVPEEGMYEFAGFSVTAMFLKGLFDKIGVQFEVVMNEEFKTAGEPYTNYKFSDSARVAYRPLIKQRENAFINAVSSFRNIEPSNVIAIMNEGILTSDEMITLGLADAFKTKRQVIAMLEEKVKCCLEKPEEKEENSLESGENTLSLRANTTYLRGNPDTTPSANAATPPQEGNFGAEAVPLPWKGGIFCKENVGVVKNTRSDGENHTCHAEFISASPRSDDDTPLEVKIATKKTDSTDFEKEYIISIADYINSEVDLSSCVCNNSDDAIAIIYGEGPILTASSGSGMFNTGETEIVSSDFVKLIEEAAKDENIKGIILRINSPGGSVIASEEIYQAVLDARKVKPVFCSMSDVAASGGYYIAMACEKIICHPHTITGSIGVVSAISNVNGTMKKLGIGADTITTGVGNTTFLSPLFPLKQSDRERFRKFSNKIYNNFVNKAAKSRGMSFEEMRAVAKGRVWTGEDAKVRGLVDTLGNLDLAIEMMKAQLDNEDLGINIYPKKKDAFEEFMKLLTKKKTSVDVSLEQLGFANLSDGMKKQLNYLYTLSKISEKEKVLCAMPHLVAVE